jgi:glycosyltransferase involved in cell wall biosynthesis
MTKVSKLPGICHIITKLELGGAQTTTLFVVSHLDPSRFKPMLIAGEPGMLDPEARALKNVAFYQVPCLVRPIRPWSDLRALIALFLLLRRLKPVIAHTHSSKAGILGRWAAWFARVPVIIHTVHGYGITPSQPAWLRFLLIRLERLTGFITTCWVFVSEADMAQGLRWSLCKRDNAVVIRPGIDLRAFLTCSLSAEERNGLRAEWGVSPDHLLVGMVAPLKPQKAPQDFVAVAARVCAQLPSARFVIVGDGELRVAVEQDIRSAGLDERIRIAGWRRDIPKFMRAMDLFLLTSYWEGLPQVLLQARASRLPIVATRVGGSAEAIVEGNHGWLYNAGDIDALAERVCHILKNPEERERIRRNGGSLPEEFDNFFALTQRQQLYEKLLSDAAGGSGLAITHSHA